MAATTTNRKITLTLDAQTSGEDAIRDLAKEVEKLGKSGGEARPEFEQLSNELNDLAKQRGVISTFNELSEATEKSKIALYEAKQSVAEETAKLRELQAALQKAKEAEAAYSVDVTKASSARQQANLELIKARAAYSEYVAGIGGAKKANDEQKVVLKELSQAIREAKAEYEKSRVAVMQLTPEMDKLKSASGSAAKAVKDQESAVANTNDSLKAAQTAYDKFGNQLTEVSEKATKVGVDLKNVAAEQQRVTTAISGSLVSLDQLRDRLDKAGFAAKSSAEKIEAAFAGTGVRPLRNIALEIKKVENAMISLANETTLSQSEFQSAIKMGEARIAELRKEMQQTGNASVSFGTRLKDAFSQFGPAALVLNGVTAALGTFTMAAASIPKVTAEFQSLARTLTIVTGSTATAAKEFEYIRGIANRVGVDIVDLGKSYAKLAAATKETAITGAQTKQIFEAVAGAMGALGASSAEAENALMAVTQMVSKGVVSMEEMRQQLGERLPGSFQATAKELGITTDELTELISTGRLAASDMLPALARGLEKMYNTGAQNDTLLAKWRQFINALKETGDTIGESGLLNAFIVLGRYGAATIAALVEGFIFFGKVVGTVAAGIRAGDLKGALAELADEAEKFGDRINRIGGVGEKTNKSLTDMAKEAKATGKAFVEMADGTKVAADDILGANNGFIEFLVRSDKAQKSAESLASVQRKLAEATRSSGESAITAANALGDETDKRMTAQKVAEDNTAALGKLLEAEKAVVAIMEAEALKRAESIANGQAASDAHKKQLVDLGEEIAKRKGIVEGIERQRDANKVSAEALAIETQMLQDNSAQKEKLKATTEEFARVLGIVRSEVDAGRLSVEQLSVIENEARKVKALYVDALKDEQANVTALNQQKQAQLSLDTASVNAAIAKQKSIMQTAKIMGDEYTVTLAANNIRRLEIQLTEIQAKQKAAEAKSILASVAAQREELKVKGLLTAAKEAELRAAELGAQAKIKESEILTETVTQMKELADVTEMYGASATSAAGKADNLADSLNRVADAANKANDAQSGSDGVRTASGTALGKMGGSSQADFTETFYRRGGTIEEVKLAQQYVSEYYARNQATMLTGNLGNEVNAARLQKLAINDAVDKALAAARKELATGEKTDLGTSVNDLMTRNLSQSPLRSQDDMIRRIQRAGNEAKNQTVTVNVNLGGKTTAVNVASSADAAAITHIFKELEQQALGAY